MVKARCLKLGHSETRCNHANGPQSRRDPFPALFPLALKVQASENKGFLELLGLRHLRALFEHLVDETEILGLRCRHKVVAVQCALNRVVITTRVLHINLVEATLHLHNVFRMAEDVRSLSLEPA